MPATCGAVSQQAVDVGIRAEERRAVAGRQPRRQCDADAAQQRREVVAPRDRDGDVADRVLENQVPADDPRHQLAERRVGVGVGAAGLRNHRRQLRVAERRQRAGAAEQDEREDQRRSGAGADDVAVRRRPVRRRRCRSRRRCRRRSPRRSPASPDRRRRATRFRLAGRIAFVDEQLGDRFACWNRCGHVRASVLCARGESPQQIVEAVDGVVRRDDQAAVRIEREADQTRPPRRRASAPARARRRCTRARAGQRFDHVAGCLARRTRAPAAGRSRSRRLRRLTVRRRRGRRDRTVASVGPLT